MRGTTANMLGVTPCEMAPMAATATSQMFFKLHCILSMISSMNHTHDYNPKLFSNNECGLGCCSTRIDSLGELTDGETTPKLFNRKNAENTIDAILSSRHCKCKFSTPILSIGCDCSQWSALHRHRWENTDTPEYTKLMARLDRCDKEASKMQMHLAAMKEISQQELSATCGNLSYTKESLGQCTIAASACTPSKNALLAG